MGEGRRWEEVVAEGREGGGRRRGGRRGGRKDDVVGG